MKNLLLALTLVLGSSFAVSAHAENAAPVTANDSNAMDELDPYAADINQTLQQMDEDYQNSTGQSPFASAFDINFSGASCYRQSCAVYIQVIKSEQRAYLYIQGELEYTWLVSTGVPGRGTPNFDKHPDGRIYDRYTSTKFPGGDYDGLGNMPYAVFIEGGFAIHGTGQGNWKHLGHVASHGCIRLHPDNAKIFNRLVRANGVSNTWITVQ